MSLSPYIISPADQYPHHCVLITIHYITSRPISTSLCPYLHTSNHQPISIHTTVSLSPYLLLPADQYPHHCVLITIHYITSRPISTSLCPYHHTSYHQPTNIHITVSLSPYIILPADQYPHHCVLISIHYITSRPISTSLCPYLHTLYHQLTNIHITVSLSPYIILPADQYPHHCVLISIHYITSRPISTSLCPYHHTLYYQPTNIHITVSLSPYIISPADQYPHHCVLITIPHITSRPISTSLCPYLHTLYHQPTNIHITVSLSPYLISPADQYPHHCVLISIHYITSRPISTSLCPYHHTSNHQPISIHITASLSPYIISPAHQHPHHCVLVSIHYITSQSASTSLRPYLHTLYHQPISIHITASLSPYIISPANQHPHHCVLISIHYITSQSASTSLRPYLHTLYHQPISIHITASLSPYIILPADQYPHHCVLITIHYITSRPISTSLRPYLHTLYHQPTNIHITVTLSPYIILPADQYPHHCVLITIPHITSRPISTSLCPYHHTLYHQPTNIHITVTLSPYIILPADQYPHHCDLITIHYITSRPISTSL